MGIKMLIQNLQINYFVAWIFLANKSAVMSKYLLLELNNDVLPLDIEFIDKMERGIIDNRTENEQGGLHQHKSTYRRIHIKLLEKSNI